MARLGRSYPGVPLIVLRPAEFFTVASGDLSASGSAVATTSTASIASAAASASGLAVATLYGAGPAMWVIANGFRITEDGDERITEDGIPRLLDESALILAEAAG